MKVWQAPVLLVAWTPQRAHSDGHTQRQQLMPGQSAGTGGQAYILKALVPGTHSTVIRAVAKQCSCVMLANHASIQEETVEKYPDRNHS